MAKDKTRVTIEDCDKNLNDLYEIACYDEITFNCYYYGI